MTRSVDTPLTAYGTRSFLLTRGKGDGMSLDKRVLPDSREETFILTTKIIIGIT